MAKSETEVPDYVAQYCAKHDYTEPQLVDGCWWAYPPGAVMPVRVHVPIGIAFEEAAAQMHQGFQELAESLRPVIEGFSAAMAVLPDEYLEELRRRRDD